METKETRSWYIFRVIQKSTFLVYIMILMVSVLSCVDTQAQQSKSFVIQQIEAQPGQKVSGKLIVEKGIDEGTFIKRFCNVQNLVEISFKIVHNKGVFVVIYYL